MRRNMCGIIKTEMGDLSIPDPIKKDIDTAVDLMEGELGWI